jgi:D-alanyl-lipoteichoic acid acyltransferase DltB (MBOAT superfamily)
MFGVHLCHFKLSSSVLLSAVVLFIFILPAIITKEKKVLATNVNLLNTMLLGGLWHGASWNFIIWGALHGVALAIHKIWVLLTGSTLKNINNSRWYNILAGIVTFHFVCFCWIFFKAPDFESSLAMLYQISHKLSFTVWGAFFANYKAVLGMIAIALVLHLIPDDAADKFLSRFTKVPMVAYMAAFFLFVLLYGYFKSAEPVLPIYLQF